MSRIFHDVLRIFLKHIDELSIGLSRLDVKRGTDADLYSWHVDAGSGCHGPGIIRYYWAGAPLGTGGVLGRQQ